MVNTAEKLTPLLLPVVIVSLWLLSGWGFEALLTAGNGRIPIYLASLVSPDTMPVRIKSLLDGSGLVLVAGLTALAVAAFALVILPDGRKGGSRGVLFLANWMSVTLAAVAGSAVLAAASVLAQWPLGRAQWIFDLVGPSLLTGAYWGVAWGWVPALVATFLSARASAGAGTAENRHSARDSEDHTATRVPQRAWALGAFALFSAAMLVALPLSARDSSQPAPAPVATPTPEPTVYGADPVGAALSEPDPQWCTGDEVKASIGGWDAATGHRVAQITLRNTGTRTCTMQGYPDLDFESSDGWVMGITAVHGGSHMTDDSPVGPFTLAPGEAAIASIGWRGTAGADMIPVGTLLVAPYSGTQRQELEADIDLAEPGFLTVTAWAPVG